MLNSLPVNKTKFKIAKYYKQKYIYPIIIKHSYIFVTVTYEIPMINIYIYIYILVLYIYIYISRAFHICEIKNDTIECIYRLGNIYNLQKKIDKSKCNNK